MNRENNNAAPEKDLRQRLLEQGGIINVNKPAGLTSHDVVNRVRRLLSVRKVGHTGTLDPMATGVLPVCVGRATRIMEYLDMDRKIYQCTLKLGRSYDTQDTTGTVVTEATEESVNAITEDEVRQAFAGLTGLVEQYPPMYSAVKIDGRKLYEYARTGQTQHILDKVKPRQIYIWELEVHSVSLGRGYDSQVDFSVVCSKGTYIRSICHEVGERLGVGAAMDRLVRSGSGGFVLEDAVDMQELEEMTLPAVCGIMRAPEQALTVFGEIHMHGSLDIRRITNGLPVWTKHVKVRTMPLYAKASFPLPIQDRFRRTYLAYAMPGHIFLGIVTMDENEENIRADKMFANGADVLAGMGSAGTEGEIQ